MRQPLALRLSLLASLATAFALSACDDPDAPPADAGPGPTDSAMPADAPGGDGSIPEDAGVPADALPDGSTPAPPLCTPDPSIDDADLAMQALRILGSTAAGATTERCSECHTLSRSRIRFWRALSDTARRDCLTGADIDTAAGAAAALTCLEDPEASAITSERLGIFSAAADLGWFQHAFERGVTGDWAAAHALFVEEAGMPTPAAEVATPLSQDEFDIVCDWFQRGVPELDAVIPSDPLPTTCLPGVSEDVLTHVASMATTGWGARNAAAGMLMHGCAGATSAAGCLATEPLASTTAFGADWEDVASGGVPGAHLRVLYTTDYATAWWTRATPDGRFVSHGAASAPNLRFVDLASDRVIGGNATYDPDFFPDASGFMVQGSGARVCEQRVLTTGMPTMLTFTEPGCSSAAGVGLYQHIGAALSGGDYWAIASNGAGSEYDNGGQSVTRRDPAADYTASAAVEFTFFTNDGTRFVRGASTEVTTPYEGDHVLSPSLSTVLTRIAGPGEVPLGYVLRRIVTTGSGAARTIELPEIGRYCIQGAKPSISYDERWMATHHYIGDADAVPLGFTGPSDPAFAEYRARGGANVFLVDLTTGASYRITNMGPGQYALFPHFRSDGWLYMMVRTEGETPEHVVASDAPLLLP